MNTFSIREEWRYNRKHSRRRKRIERYYRNKFKRLAMNMHDYELPENLDYTILEKYLYEDGQAVIWKSPTFGLTISRVSIVGWDKNNRGRRFRPHHDTREAGRWESHDITLNYDECAIFYDTTDPDILTRDALALVPDLVDTHEIIRQQVSNQRTPLLGISADESVRKKIKNMMVDTADGVQIMIIEDDLTGSVKPLDLNAPFNIERLHADKKELENEILEYMGVDSTDAPMKKERMIVDEVEGNDELLNYFLHDRLKARQDGIDRMKQNLNLDGSVEIREIVRPLMVETGEVQGNLGDWGGGW